MLYYRSLQVAPLSITAPLFGLTPVFLLFTGFVIFHQIPSVRLTCRGLLHPSGLRFWRIWSPSGRPFATATLTCFLREKGVAPMLSATFLLAITNLLDKWLVMRLDVFSYAWLYVVLCAFFTGCLVAGPASRY